MDVFKTIIDGLVEVMRAEMGSDIFTDAQRGYFEQTMAAQTMRYEREIRHQYGKATHYCASDDAYDRARRNAEIIRQLMAGLSTQQVAERFNLPDRHIRRIRQQAIDSGVYKNGRLAP